MTKPELRAQLTLAVRARTSIERKAESEAICTAVRAHPSWSAARRICAFLPLPSEPQIAALWEGEPARAFCFPRVECDDVVLIQLDDPELLRRSDWKFEAEEIAAAPRVDAREVDVFLVPGLGFTPRGGRLGRGGGYYDRLLARRRAGSVALGLCFACQIVPEVPSEPHDQWVDAVLTGEF